MTNKTKSQLITAVSLIVIGCIIFGGSLMAIKFDFKNISTVKYETNEHVIEGAYKNIFITSETADILFVPTDSAVTTVTCYEETKAKHSVELKNETLVISVKSEKKWYDHIGIDFDSPKITVNLPAGEYGDITIDATTGDLELPSELSFYNIQISVTTGDITDRASAAGSVSLKTTTGAISVENISAGSLDLKATTGKGKIMGATVNGDVDLKISTGKMNITDLTCINLTANGTTSDLILKNVISKGKFDIERSTGDIKLDGCDAAELFIKTSTGDVTGTLLSDKSFVTKTTTGDVNVPDTTGGKCEISVTTGDIKIDIE